jgi:hypothetical protein
MLALTVMLPADNVPLVGTVMFVILNAIQSVLDVLRSPFHLIVDVLLAVVIVVLLKVGAAMLLVNDAIPSDNVTPAGILLNVSVKAASFVVNGVNGGLAPPDVRSAPAN